LKDFFVKDWQKRLKESSSGKLCSYYLFKNNFGCENYLSLIKNLNTEGAWQDFVYQLTNYISKLVDILAFSGTIEYAHSAPLMRLKMSNIISLLVLVWNQKGKYYLIPLKKGGINFKHLNNKNKLIWLLNTEDKNILLELCKFLCLI
jgi:hypothetical protein